MRLGAFAVVLLLGCPPSAQVSEAGAGGGAGGAGGGTGEAGGGAEQAGVAGQALLSRLAGLWSGPATMTRLGDFPNMTMDLRPVGDSFLFGQTDFDAANLLRFGFNIETHGADVLSYRNGGYFNGVLRDSGLALVDSTADSWHFCAVSGGCASIDARFTQTGAQLVLDATVRGAPHLHWVATRLETRDVPAVFPAAVTSQGDGTEPWPPMATVQVNVSWSPAVTAPADVWLVLTTTPCLPAFSCHPSRAIFTSVDTGARAASLTLTSVHSGAYYATVVVDLDRNFATTGAPSHGDRMAIDQALTVSSTGTTTVSAMASVAVP